MSGHAPEPPCLQAFLDGIEFRRICGFRSEEVRPSRWYVTLPHSLRRILHPDCLLAAIKLLRTAVWTVMAGSILALPVAAFTGNFRWALLLTAFVVCECAVLAANRGRCPLTDWAARFTGDRAANFDIYLPEWVAREQQGDIWHPLCGERIDCALALAQSWRALF